MPHLGLSCSSHGNGIVRKKWRVVVITWLLTSHLAVLQVTPCLEALSAKVSRTRQGWQVSSHGRVRNTRGEVSYGHFAASGYYVSYIGGKIFQVHRLIARAFCGPPARGELWQVDHIDGNRSNNHRDNLKWTTPAQNVQSYHANPSRGTAGLWHSKPVMVRPVGSQNWTSFRSAREASEQLAMPCTTLRHRCRNNARVKGMEFKYAEPENQKLAGEEWKPMLDPRSGEPVPGRMVSSLGRITSKHGRMYKGSRREDGYYRTLIWGGLQRRVVYVHQLVAYVFLGPPPPSPERTEINHKDLDRGNNAAKNLEYVTPAENIAHSVANMKGPHPLSLPILSRVYGSSDEWRFHESVTSAAQCLGLFQCSVSNCLHGRQSQTGGYEFCVATPDEAPVETLLGEEWRDVDVDWHLRERALRSGHGVS